MKKKVLTYLTGIGLFIVVLSFCYYGSYRLSANRFQKEHIYHADTDYDDFSAELVKADTTQIDRISESTRCVLEIYDLQDQVTNVKAAEIKRQFYGFTREEVLLYLEAFMEDMPDREKNQGLVSYEMVSFGANELVLRKSYDKNRIKYEFFLKAEGEEIVVYFSDMTRIYEYTGIVTTYLSKEDREKLKEGFYVENKEELYGILETYSS